jgi:MraZ protein
MVFAEAAYLDFDRQGRILVPPELRRYADIEREAVIIGMNTYLEIWSPARWSAQSEMMDEQGSSIAERLAEFI